MLYTWDISDELKNYSVQLYICDAITGTSDNISGCIINHFWLVISPTTQAMLTSEYLQD